MCRKVQTLKNKLEVKHTNGLFSTSAEGMNSSNAKKNTVLAVRCRACEVYTCRDEFLLCADLLKITLTLSLCETEGAEL